VICQTLLLTQEMNNLMRIATIIQARIYRTDLTFPAASTNWSCNIAAKSTLLFWQ